MRQLNTRRNYDVYEEQDMDTSNQKIANYHTKNMMNSDNNRSGYMNSMMEIGNFPTGDYNGFPNAVTKESELRNGISGNSITQQKEKNSKLLMSRPFNVGYMGAGQTYVKDVALNSQIVQGVDTRVKKSADSLSGVSMDRFIPLVPCLEKNVQDTKHIIPEYWVRGGMSTRGLIQNIDYYKMCGIKR